MCSRFVEEQGNWNRKTYINNIDPKFNLNALHIACAFGKTAIVNYLLFQGADTEIPDKNDGYYPLHHAVESGCLETLIALQNKRREKLGRNAILTVKAVETQRTPLHSAAFCNYPEMAEWLINQGIDVNCQEKVTGYTALHTAAYRGNREIINVLLDNAEKTNLKVFKQNANKNKKQRY